MARTLLLQLNPASLKKDLDFMKTTCVLVPLHCDTGYKLSGIQDLNIANLENNSYKPMLLEHASMFANETKWCKYTLVQSNGYVVNLSCCSEKACMAFIYKLHISSFSH